MNDLPADLRGEPAVTEPEDPRPGGSAHSAASKALAAAAPPVATRSDQTAAGDSRAVSAGGLHHFEPEHDATTPTNDLRVPIRR